MMNELAMCFPQREAYKVSIPISNGGVLLTPLGANTGSIKDTLIFGGIAIHMDMIHTYFSFYQFWF